MELFLNLAWLALAALMCCLWRRFAPRPDKNRPADRRMQLIALAVLILILFPVISVTDDLQAAQNPAETDSCVRRDHECSVHHSIFPAAVANLPLPVFEVAPAGLLRAIGPGARTISGVRLQPLSSIQNRPPPLV
jgi:hypothetical protein